MYGISATSIDRDRIPDVTDFVSLYPSISNTSLADTLRSIDLDFFIYRSSGQDLYTGLTPAERHLLASNGDDDDIPELEEVPSEQPGEVLRG